MKLKKILLLLALALSLFLLAACGGEDERAPETDDPGETEQTVIPHTATEPPALRFDDLPHPGQAIRYTDSTGKTTLYTLIHDEGADGNTPTYCKFDSDGDLVWWCSYEYNDLGEKVKGITRDPQGTILEWDEYSYYETGGTKTWKNYNAEGVLQYEYDYYENGNFSLYTGYMDSGRTVMEYNEEGDIVHTREYDENGELYREDGEYVGAFADGADA